LKKTGNGIYLLIENKGKSDLSYNNFGYVSSKKQKEMKKRKLIINSNQLFNTLKISYFESTNYLHNNTLINWNYYRK